MATSVVIPNNYGIATLRWTWVPAGKEFTVTCGYWDSLASDNPTTAANAYRNAAIAAGGPCAAANMTSDWRFEGVTTLQRLSGGVLQTGANLTPVVGTGGSSSGINPVFTTAVISKRTAFAGRHYRGRMYAPLTLLNEGLVDWNGIIAPAQVTTIQGYWNVFMSYPTFATYPPVLLHTAPPVGPPIPPTQITTLVCQNVVGLQRRRRARA